MGTPLEGIDCDVALSASPSISTTNETATDSGDHTTYTTSVHTFWDQGKTFTVQTSPDGSTAWAAATDYVMQWPTGKIVFNTARVPGTNAFVRVSAGSYFNVTQVDEAHGWALSLKGNIAKTTPFQSAGAWERNTSTTKSGSGKIDTFRTDNRLFNEIGNLAVLQLWVDKSANIRWQFYAWLTGLDPKADATGVQEQAVSFDVEGPAYYLAS